MVAVLGQAAKRRVKDALVGEGGVRVYSILDLQASGSSKIGRSRIGRGVHSHQGGRRPTRLHALHSLKNQTGPCSELLVKTPFCDWIPICDWTHSTVGATLPLLSQPPCSLTFVVPAMSCYACVMPDNVIIHTTHSFDT